MVVPLPRLARLAFWIAALFAFVMATLPHPPQLVEVTDKWQHMLAFAVLTALASLGWPRLHWWRLLIGLSLFGAAIEVVQAIPALHRDSDVMDWVADTGAALVLLSIMVPVRRALLKRGF